MKTSDELRNAAQLAAENISNEISNGGGVTLASLARLQTLAQVCGAALNQLKERANGTAREEGK